MYIRATNLIGLLPFIACPAIWAGDLPPQEFERQLERASELNVTAPWHESQVILDRLEPHLDQASDEQYHLFKYLEARNQVLAGNLEDGLELLESIFPVASGSTHGIELYRLAANTALLLGRHESAFNYLGRALEQVSESDSNAESANVLALAAYIYAQVGQLDQAREYGHRAINHARELDHKRSLCSSQHRLAFVYKTSDDFEDALHFYRKALDACHETNDDVLISVVEYSLADLLRKAGNLSEAAELFDRAFPRLVATGYQTGISEARLYKARLHHAEGELDEAQALLDTALPDLRKDQAWNYVADAHRMLADIARARGDHEQALEHFDQRLKARENFLSMDRARQLAYLEVEFDTQYKEQQLALLQEQARVRDLEAETRRQQERLRYLGYGIAGFLVIVLILLLIHATRERRHFRSLARHDGLTGLNNHTRFFEIAQPAFEATRQGDRPFTLVLGDIDHFKRVNDEHGHLTGDEVLRRVGARLREAFGENSIVGRIGGEEFAIALPDRDADAARTPLEELRRNLRISRSEDQDIPVSMSFGVASRRGQQSLNELRQHADQALYKAKRAGRDRVEYVDDLD